MSKFKFKVGDKIRVANNIFHDYGLSSHVGTIRKIEPADVDYGYKIWLEEGRDDWWHSEFILEVLTKQSKEKQMKELKKSKFMVYGTGCNNRSERFDTEKEAREEAKRVSYDSSWTGDILIQEIKTIGVVKKDIKIEKVK
jgi:hypothetical protein